MSPGHLGELLREELDSAGIAASEGTGLHAAARDNLEMVRAYLDDGGSFLSSGDPVNAIAAYFYGEGWLHCGAACGLVSVAVLRCLFSHPAGALPPQAEEKLREKTGRYERLLGTARAAIRPAPEKGTALHITAERVAVVASFYAVQGSRFLARQEYACALACFSYGHGWIDAGVRAGLFSVISSRDLFTI